MSRFRSLLSILLSLISGVLLTTLLQNTLLDYLALGQVLEFFFNSVSIFFDILSLLTYLIWVVMGGIVGVVDESTESGPWSVLILGLLSWGFIQGTAILLGYSLIPDTPEKKIVLLLSLLVLIPPIAVGGITARIVRGQISKINLKSKKNEIFIEPFSGSKCPRCNTEYKSNPRICYNCGYEFRSDQADS